MFQNTALKLADWSRDNYFEKQDEVLEPTLRICEEIYRSGADRNGAVYPEFTDGIERVQYKELSEDQFIKKYEYGSMPVIIQGVADKWPGMKEWQIGRLLERFGKSKFKIGESDSGRKLKVTLKQYLEYSFFGRDDSPLYLFESSLEEHPEAHVMQKDYT